MNYRAGTPFTTGTSFLRIVAPVLIMSAVMIGCDDDDSEVTPPSKSIVALAQASDDLSSLEAALLRFPDLVTALGSSGNYTVFAPTNEAFDNLLDAIGQSTLADVPDEVLRDVLEYHVVAGQALKSGQLVAGDLSSVGGEPIEVSLMGGVRLNGSVSVTSADIAATNGVVHVIDAVLVPPSIAPIVGTVVAPAFFNKDFTTLIAAVKAASPDVLQALLSNERKTVFAPTNEAFEAAGIIALPSQSVLDAVLTYHVIEGDVFADDISNGSSFAETLNGRIFLSKGDAGVFINGMSRVTSTDIGASNGVVHVIDRTLLPPSQTIAEIAVAQATSASAPQFTQLVAALARTDGQGVDDLLAAAGASGSNLTVFAPTDAAFEELYQALNVNGVDEIPLQTLIAVLKHHIVAARVFSTDLSTGPVTTLNGDVTVDISSATPTVSGGSGGANVATLQTSLLNIHATNGVIHVIDKVLLP